MKIDEEHCSKIIKELSLEKGNYVLAFGALNYAHGWLDAGARLGLFDVDEDDQLFTLAE